MNKAMQRLFRGMVAEGSGLQPNRVIPGNDKGPRPREGYASVLLTDGERRAYPDFGSDDAVTTQRRSMLSVQWYRAGAVDAARGFENWAETEPGLDHAESIDMRIVFPLRFRRADEIDSDAFEERMQADIEVDWVDDRSQALESTTGVEGGLVVAGQTYTLEGTAP